MKSAVYDTEKLSLVPGEEAQEINLRCTTVFSSGEILESVWIWPKLHLRPKVTSSRAGENTFTIASSVYLLTSKVVNARKQGFSLLPQSVMEKQVV